MRILLTGANGQVGHALSQHLADRQLDYHAVDHQQCDITDGDRVRRVFEETAPTLVVNCAAYTAVDFAETNIEHCYAVNRDGVAVLAQACNEYDIPMIHFSTDYVFDGEAEQPYLEDAPVNPLGIYGDSKYQGEQVLRDSLAKHLIIRLSWVTSAHGKNFMKTMLNFARTQDKLRVVSDQWGCPTFANTVADAVLTILPQLDGHWGTYHFCQGPATSWHEFASEIIQVARHYQELRVREIEAITTAEFPTPAKRPAYSVLATEKFQQTFAYTIPEWRLSLHHTLQAYYR